MLKATIQMEDLVCPACVLKVENALKSLAGVDKDSVKVLFNSSKAKFSFDPDAATLEQASQAIEALGYNVLKAEAK